MNKSKIDVKTKPTTISKPAETSTIPPNTVFQHVTFVDVDQLPSATHIVQCLLRKFIEIKRIQFNFKIVSASNAELAQVKRNLHNAMYRIRKSMQAQGSKPTAKPKNQILLGIHKVKGENILLIKFFATRIELETWRAAIAKNISFEPPRTLNLGQLNQVEGFTNDL